MDARSARLAAAILLLPVWRRPSALYRRRLCVDGGDHGARNAGTNMEPAPRARTSGRASAFDYIAPEIRNEDAATESSAPHRPRRGLMRHADLRRGECRPR